MKKKLKLFISIMCLCLTLGIGIFGVYSALQITYSITGFVKYEVKGALVEVTTKIYEYNQRTNLDSGTQKMNELKELSHDDIDLAVAKDEHGEEYVDTFKSFTDDLVYDESKQEGIFDEIVLDFNKSLTYYIVVNIKVYNNDSGVDATVTADNFSIANTWNAKTEDLTQILSSHKDGKNIVFACGVDDVASNAEGTFDYTITFEKKDLENVNAVSNYKLNNTEQVNDSDIQTVTVSSKDENATKNIPMHILNFTIDNTNQDNNINTFKVDLTNVKINGVNATSD